MKDVPIVEFKVRALGEQFGAMIATRSEEIRAHIEKGFNRAADTLADTIVQMAADEATKQFQKEVNEYFAWGKGRDAIREAVKTALEPVAAAMSGKQ